MISLKTEVSCDWDRQRFTLDDGCSHSVYTFFKKLYEDGYIYRDEKIVNYALHVKQQFPMLRFLTKIKKDSFIILNIDLKIVINF